MHYTAIICMIMSFFLNIYLFATPFPIRYLKSTYVDAELQQLWDSMDNIYAPTIEDYEKVQNYLENGLRPYLDLMFDHGIKTGLIKSQYVKRNHTWWNRLLQKIKFVHPDSHKPPTYKVLNLEVPKNDRSRCIVLYASCNTDSFDCATPYSNRLLDIINDLRRAGYKGHVLYRIGGYPATQFGGLRLAHVPYSFKVLSLIEASHLGYENVLWLDCALHPLHNLDNIFKTIEKKGVFLLKNGATLKQDYTYKILPDKTIESWGLQYSDLQKIEHIVATIVGVSFNSKKGHTFMNEWYRLTAKTTPSMSLFPEEFLISVSSYLTNIPATGEIHKYFDSRAVIPTKPSTSHPKPFWFDKGPK
jgi:hypothetical protein